MVDTWALEDGRVVADLWERVPQAGFASEVERVEQALVATGDGDA